MISRDTQQRSGFTLVELLVVISVLLILMTMTISAVNFAFSDEEVGSAARQVQSSLEGARTRAIRAKAPRGVRFFRDTELGASSTAGLGLITSMAYVAPGTTWDEGNIRLERAAAADTLATIVAGNWETFWWELYHRDQLTLGMRIKIPNAPSGTWYTIVGLGTAITTGTGPTAFDPNNPYPMKLTIAPAYRDPATSPVGTVEAYADGGPTNYELELPPQILPTQPVLLPEGTCIDEISSANLPIVVTDPSFPSQPFFDIMFAPRGTVIGPAASSGIMHFYVCETQSSFAFRDFLTENSVDPAPGVPIVPADDFSLGGQNQAAGRRAVVTTFTQTGRIAASELNPTDGGDADVGVADDPYQFAETSVGVE